MIEFRREQWRVGLEILLIWAVKVVYWVALVLVFALVSHAMRATQSL